MGATMHLEDWEKVAMKIMKVASTSDIPQPLDSDGIAIAPYYNKDNANYTSKVQRSAAYRSVVEGWLVEDEARVNKELLEALNAGVSAPLLYVYDSCNLDVLLKDVGAQYIRINWIVEGNPSILLDRWIQWALNQGLELEQLSGASSQWCFLAWGLGEFCAVQRFLSRHCQTSRFSPALRHLGIRAGNRYAKWGWIKTLDTCPNRATRQGLGGTHQ
jgi:hypothetical protein